jgi:hypothetical protein
MSHDDTYLRDVFAGLALNGIIPLTKTLKSVNWDKVSVDCYKIADAMMKARKNETED